MTEKQEHLLVLMREIDEICKKHHLRYVMAGGSLIGVVRNEGFIPWDDDVDIYMPKADWDKFVELSATEFPPDRAIHCVDVDREYTNTFPRYADTASCAIHKHQLIGNDSAGEIIDVLTLDPIPPDDREYEKYRTHMMIYSELVNVAFVYGNRWEIPVTLYLKYLFYYWILGRDRTLKKLEDIMFSYKEEDCSRYAMRWGGCPFLFDKDMMFPVKYMKFEGIQVMVPQRTSDYLIWHYGDEWSYIPPHEERTSHNAITVEGITYQELRDDYMKKVDAAKIKRDSVFRKIYSLFSAKKKHRLMRERNLLKAKSVEMDLKARICENPCSLTELMEKHEFSILNDIFSQYFQVQLSAEFIGREDFANIYPFYHPGLVEISEEAFLSAMMTLIYTERVGKAYRMLQVKEKLDRLTPGMQQIADDIVLFRRAVCHYEMHEKPEAEQITAELLNRYPDNPGFMKLMCRLVMERAMEQEEYTEAETFLDHALETFRDDGYFLKYYADLVLKQKGKDHALPLYAEAREKTNNGITHLEIEKYLKAEREDALIRCRSLLQENKKEEAVSWMELWMRLLPDDGEITGYLYLVRAALAENEKERGTLKEELESLFKTQKNLPEDKQPEVRAIFREALEVLLKKNGYSCELAMIRSAMLLTDSPDKLKQLGEQLGEPEDRGDGCGIALKLAGDIQNRMGCTEQAFLLYGRALEYPLPAGDFEEISQIILKDFYKGGKKAALLSAKTDALGYLDRWLGKYGTIGQLKALQERLSRGNCTDKRNENGAEAIE